MARAIATAMATTSSANHGVEGPTADPAIPELRRRHVRNLLATLLLSQGTPMLAMGDEVLRSQGGNNNAYCQDNPISWLDWGTVDAEDAAMAGFVGRLAALRQAHPALCGGRFTAMAWPATPMGCRTSPGTLPTVGRWMP